MKKRIISILLILVMLLTMTACSSEESGSENPDAQGETTDKDNSQGNQGGSGNNNVTNVEGTANGNAAGFDEEELAIYNALFDVNNKVKVKVTISQEEIQKIQADYKRYSKSPVYRIAEKVTFDINGTIYEIEDVGIRMKGNTSRRDLYGDDGRFYLTHFRLSFDETFDDEEYYGSEARVWDSEEERKERKKRTFATLSSLELKYNGTYDYTYTCELYSHEFFINNGVLAQKCNKAVFNMADTDFGVYTIYEPVDDTFIERNLPQEDWGGDLYKVQWTRHPGDYCLECSYGIEDETRNLFYNYDLKTNKKSSDHSSLTNLFKVVNTQMNQEALESVVDVDYFLKFAATSYFAGCADDMRNNFNNHYVYFKKSDGKAIFIPYDYDRCFGHANGYNPGDQCLTNFSPFEAFAAGSRYGASVNPIFMQTVTTSGYYLDEYKAELQKLMDSEWLTYDKFLSYYNKIEANYKDDAVPTYNFKSLDEQALAFRDNNINGNMHFDRYVEAIIKTCKDCIENN